VQYNGGKVSRKSFDHPPLGQVTTVNIGEPMVNKGLIMETTVLSVKQPINGFSYKIPAQQYPQIGHDERNDYFSAVGVIKNAFADPFNGLAVARTPGAELCVVTVFGATSCYKGAFSREKVTAVGKESFQQTLLYSGRVGNKVNISYREYSNDMARPAFNNDAEYDLSSSNIIGYRGASIEVLSADNSSITYRVLSNFR
jgi:hypothetical protein